MDVLGIVAEYNPFHTGHMYHIQKAKAETGALGVVAVMSGSFVQRGEPAVYDKWTRAFHALSHGADLVLELPAVYALSSADGFAFGAVHTLRATGVVNILSFGSECGDLARLRTHAKAETPAFRARLRHALRKGESYAKAYDVAKDGCGTLGSNDILGAAYLRHVGTSMGVHTVKRIGAGYLDETAQGEYASAYAIRKRLFAGENCEKYMPYRAVEKPHHMDAYEQLLLYAVGMASFADYPHLSQVVRTRLLKSNKQSWDSLLESAKTRNITMAAIKRAAMQILIQNTVPASIMPQYIRVLGFTERGREILKEMKKKAMLPIITRTAAWKTPSPIWETEKRATDVYFLPDGIAPGEDMRRAPVKI